MLNIRNLQKRFGENTAVDIDAFDINDGDIIGLVGNNGAGKTTLFRLMLDLLKADTGDITLTVGHADNAGSQPQTINIAHSEAWKSHVGAYIDDGFLIDFLTPEEYFAFIGKISSTDRNTIDSRLETFRRFTNGEIFDGRKLIRDLSAGNKQKVGIISAFLLHPQTVILDEPFNFLDPSSQNTLKQIIADYRRDTGATVIISSHNLSHTIDVCTRIILLEHGRIIRDISDIKKASAELEQYFAT